MPRKDGSLTPADKRRRKRLNTPLPGVCGEIFKWEDIIREGTCVDARKLPGLQRSKLPGQFHFLFVYRWCAIEKAYTADLQVRYRGGPRARWQAIGFLEEMMDYSCFIRAGHNPLPIMQALQEIQNVASDNGGIWWDRIFDIDCVLEENGYGPENFVPV